MLTDREVKNAEPRLKVYKLYDGNGLLLRVKPNGSKSWEFKYRVNGEGKRVEKLLSLGTYNEVGLKEARQKCAEARRMCSASLDPSTERKRQKQLAKFNAENTFSNIAEEWIQKVSAKWTPRYTEKLRRRMELHLLDQLGKRPISDISTLDLLEALRRPEAAGKVETAHRVLQVARSIFQYAVLTQRIKYNPANDLRGVLQSYQEAHYPTIGHNHLPGFLSDLENVETTALNRLAVKLLMGNHSGPRERGCNLLRFLKYFART
jgi:Arm DNA-binding domain/Phage integrase, N-terminal SAM-like domain